MWWYLRWWLSTLAQLGRWVAGWLHQDCLPSIACCCLLPGFAPGNYNPQGSVSGTLPDHTKEKKGVKMEVTNMWLLGQPCRSQPPNSQVVPGENFDGRQWWATALAAMHYTLLTVAVRGQGKDCPQCKDR